MYADFIGSAGRYSAQNIASNTLYIHYYISNMLFVSRELSHYQSFTLAISYLIFHPCVSSHTCLSGSKHMLNLFIHSQYVYFKTLLRHRKINVIFMNYVQHLRVSNSASTRKFSSIGITREFYQGKPDMVLCCLYYL